MNKLETILAEHPFLQALDKSYIDLIVGCASEARFDRGQYLFRATEEAHKFYVIRNGLVRLEVSAPGRGSIAIETIGEGEVLGWSWLFPPYHWHYDAVAVESTGAIALDGACLRGKCEMDHDLGFELLKRFSHLVDERLQATRMQLLDLYGEPAQDDVAVQ